MYMTMIMFMNNMLVWNVWSGSHKFG